MGRPKKYVGLTTNEVRMLRYHRQVAEYMELLGGACVVCRGTEDLEFDHIDPNSKSFAITSIVSHRRAKVLAELEKCQLLCRDCHQDKTYEGRGTRAHGTPTMYNQEGCRCLECRAYRSREYQTQKSRR